MAPVWRAVFPDSKRLKTSSSPSTSHSFTPHRTVEGKSTEKHFLDPSTQICGQESRGNEVDCIYREIHKAPPQGLSNNKIIQADI